MQRTLLSRGLWGALVVALALIAGAGVSGAAILTVDTALDVVDGGDGVLSLREALAAANPADEIQFDSSLNGQTIVLNGTQLNVTVDLTITGPGADLLTIDANLQSRVMNVLSVTATISGLTFTRGGGNNAGAGINNIGTLEVRDSVIADNQGPANQVGGGLQSQIGTLTLIRCTVRDNTGEGIRAQTGGVTVIDSTVSGSTATGLIAASGSAPVLIVGSTFVGNTGGAGGGLSNAASGVTMTVINSTISGNTATVVGGGIWAGGAPFNLINSTVTNNTATNHGGGITRGSFIASDNTVIRNSIVAGNTAPVDADCSTDFPGGMYVTDDHNVFGDGTGCLVGASDETVTDVTDFIGPLADNGGETETHVVLPVAGSPVLDGGDPDGCTDDQGAPLTSDQRGEPRPQGSACDVGAVEIFPPLPAAPAAARLALLAGVALAGALALAFTPRKR